MKHKILEQNLKSDFCGFQNRMFNHLDTIMNSEAKDPIRFKMEYIVEDRIWRVGDILRESMILDIN